jgi:hypothetical protein
LRESTSEVLLEAFCTSKVRASAHTYSHGNIDISLLTTIRICVFSE